MEGVAVRQRGFGRTAAVITNPHGRCKFLFANACNSARSQDSICQKAHSAAGINYTIGYTRRMNAIVARRFSDCFWLGHRKIDPAQNETYYGYAYINWASWRDGWPTRMDTLVNDAKEGFYAYWNEYITDANPAEVLTRKANKAMLFRGCDGMRCNLHYGYPGDGYGPFLRVSKKAPQ